MFESLGGVFNMPSALPTPSIIEVFEAHTSFQFHVGSNGLVRKPLPSVFSHHDALVGEPVMELLETLLEDDLRPEVEAALHSAIRGTSVRDAPERNPSPVGQHEVSETYFLRYDHPATEDEGFLRLAFRPEVEGGVLDVEKVSTHRALDENVLGTLPVGVVRLEPGGSVVVNKAARNLLGLKGDGHDLTADIRHEDGTPLLQSTWSEFLRHLSTSALTLRVERLPTPLWLLVNVQATADTVVATLTDISEQREQAPRQGELYDPLTQLPREVLLTDRLEQTIARARRASKYFFALLFIDIDNFQDVNTALGRQGGDAILAEVAEQLKHGLRATDTLARLDDDRFIILLDDAVMLADAVEVAGRALSLFEGSRAGISASIGIAMGDKTISGPYHILNHARAALREAKENGKSRYAVYSKK